MTGRSSNFRRPQGVGLHGAEERAERPAEELQGVAVEVPVLGLRGLPQDQLGEGLFLREPGRGAFEFLEAASRETADPGVSGPGQRIEKPEEAPGVPELPLAAFSARRVFFVDVERLPRPDGALKPLAKVFGGDWAPLKRSSPR